MVSVGSGNAMFSAIFFSYAPLLSFLLLRFEWPSLGFQFRTIQPLLLASNSLLGARVIWMSSLEASPKFYDAEDWQLKKTEHSYENSKYQIDLIATHLDCLSLQESQLSESKRTIRHFVAEPGICSTNISHALVNPFTEFCKLMIFYLVCADRMTPPFFLLLKLLPRLAY